MRELGSIALPVLFCMLSAQQASAELVFLTNGRSLSVKAYRADETGMILTLRGGGEIRCDRALVVRIEPDEVPYLEDPAVESAGVGDVSNEEPGSVSAAAHTAAFHRETRYASLIEPLARRHRVHPDLVRALIEVESGYVSRARSPKGAMGLMQLMPSTARQYAVTDPFDPVENLDAGIKHLRTLLDRYDVPRALAAYNAGEAAVARYKGVPPFKETRDYVARILQRAGAGTSPPAGRRATPRRVSPAIATGGES
jgi:hypothetical protein